MTLFFTTIVALGGLLERITPERIEVEASLHKELSHLSAG